MGYEDVDIELCNKRRYTTYPDDEKTRFFSPISLVKA